MQVDKPMNLFLISTLNDYRKSYKTHVCAQNVNFKDNFQYCPFQ